VFKVSTLERCLFEEGSTKKECSWIEYVKECNVEAYSTAG
jgi:hypothetical protein